MTANNSHIFDKGNHLFLKYGGLETWIVKWDASIERHKPLHADWLIQNPPETLS
jgi:hypothetical protein